MKAWGWGGGREDSQKHAGAEFMLVRFAWVCPWDETWNQDLAIEGMFTGDYGDGASY